MEYLTKPQRRLSNRSSARSPLDSDRRLDVFAQKTGAYLDEAVRCIRNEKTVRAFSLFARESFGFEDDPDFFGSLFR
jgi:hypothetical protein